MKLKKLVTVAMCVMMTTLSLQSQASIPDATRADIEKKIEEVQTQIQELQNVKLKGTDWTVGAGKHLLVLTGTMATGLILKGNAKNTDLLIGKTLLTGAILEGAMIKIDSNSIEESVKSKRAALAVMYAQLKKLSEEAGSDRELNRILKDQQEKIKARISEIRQEVAKLDQLRMSGATFSTSLKQVVVGLGSAAVFYISRGNGGKITQNLGAALLAFTAAESVVVYLDTQSVNNTIEDLTAELSQLEGQLPQAR